MITLRFPNFGTAIDAGMYLDDNGIDFYWARGAGGLPDGHGPYTAVIDPSVTDLALPSLLRQYIHEVKEETPQSPEPLPDPPEPSIVIRGPGKGGGDYPFKIPSVKVLSPDDVFEEMHQTIEELLLALDVTLIVAGEKEINLGVGLTILGAKERGDRALKLKIDNTD